MAQESPEFKFKFISNEKILAGLGALQGENNQLYYSLRVLQEENSRLKTQQAQQTSELQVLKDQTQKLLERMQTTEAINHYLISESVRRSKRKNSKLEKELSEVRKRQTVATEQKSQEADELSPFDSLAGSYWFFIYSQFYYE